MSDHTSITLVKNWNGRRAGTVLPIAPTGMANLLIKNGFAVATVAPEPKPKPKRKRRTKKEMSKNG